MRSPRPTDKQTAEQTNLMALAILAILGERHLVTEMTGSSAVLLPMLMACFVAMQVPTMLGGAPLSETLRARTLKIQESITAGGGARQDNISRETLPSRKFEHWRDDRFFFFCESLALSVKLVRGRAHCCIYLVPSPILLTKTACQLLPP